MKKCIVLDLDNTLWGGIVGEDGIDGIALSLTSPGNSFIAFQQALLDHYNMGIILTINSRNNETDAWDVIHNHPNMILKEHHFAAHRINWNDKAQNIKELAVELNIGLDSMVFIDDDQTNREMVRALVPDVETPEMPNDPREYARFLHSLPYFDSSMVTDEDTMRGNLYVTERLRRQQEKEFETKEEFLRSLGLTLSIYQDDDSCVARLAQLSEKTNQFNNEKNPYSEEQIQVFIVDPRHTIFYGKLQDRFGDYGVIIFAHAEIGQNVWHISSLLMSCRVFGRGVEDAFLAYIMKRAQESGVDTITIAYSESPKNMPAKTFIDEHFINQTITTRSASSSPLWIQTVYENI